MSGFDWLWQGKEDAKSVKLSEGSEFAPGFSGKWKCCPMWRIWDGSGITPEELKIEVNGVQTFPSGSFYYWSDDNYDSGMKMSNALGLKFGPKQVWRWELPTVDAVGLGQAAIEQFGNTISMEVGIGGFGGRDRIDLHLIALPSCVQAMAVAGGLLKEPIFDYKELLKDVAFLTDDWQHEMVGGDSDWESSKLWKVRTEIWKVFGEDNPRAYMYGSGRNVTENKVFGEHVLRVLYDGNGTSIWARLMRVPNPKVDAVTKDGKRLGVLAVDKVYRTKEEAEADSGANAAAEAKSNSPALPEQWKGSRIEDWTEWLKDFLSENGMMGIPKPLVMNKLNAMSKELASKFACTPEEIEPWLDSVIE